MVIALAIAMTKELIVALAPLLLVPMLLASKALSRWSKGKLSIGESLMLVALACCALLTIALTVAFWASCVAAVLGADSSPFVRPAIQAEAP